MLNKLDNTWFNVGVNQGVKPEPKCLMELETEPDRNQKNKNGEHWNWNWDRKNRMHIKYFKSFTYYGFQGWWPIKLNKPTPTFIAPILIFYLIQDIEEICFLSDK